MVRALFILLLAAAPVRAEPLAEGEYAVIGPLTPALTRGQGKAMAVHVTVEGGRIAFAFVTADQPVAADCAAGGQCTWVVRPFAMQIGEDARGRLTVEAVERTGTGPVMSADADQRLIHDPIRDFVNGSRVGAAGSEFTLTNYDRDVLFAPADLTAVKGAILLSDLARPGDAALRACYLDQVAAMTGEGDPERAMLSMLEFVAHLGDVSALSWFWREATPEGDVYEQVIEANQRIALLGGLLYTRHTGPETEEALVSELKTDLLIADIVGEEADTAIADATDGWWPQILALRRYRHALEAARQGGLAEDGLRDRLCESILIDGAAD